MMNQGEERSVGSARSHDRRRGAVAAAGRRTPPAPCGALAWASSRLPMPMIRYPEEIQGGSTFSRCTTWPDLPRRQARSRDADSRIAHGENDVSQCV